MRLAAISERLLPDGRAVYVPRHDADDHGISAAHEVIHALWKRRQHRVRF